MKTTFVLLTLMTGLFGGVLAGCGENSLPVDQAPGTHDAGLAPDAQASALHDSGSPGDAGEGSTADAGTDTDAGQPAPDSGLPRDAGEGGTADAGTEADAGQDEQDAGSEPVGQHQNANLYAFWNYQGESGFWNVDQILCVGQKAPKTYWAQYWTWTGQSYGGYIGIQTDGYRFDGTYGDTALFSLWNADAAQGPMCGEFGGEGTGYSCRATYPFEAGRCYRLRVWRLASDATGQWWGGWLRDESTQVEIALGQIHVAVSAPIYQPMNFAEYYGPQVSCDAVPVSTVQFTSPAANQLSPGTYEYGSTFDRSTRASCTGGSVTEVDLGWTHAAEVTMGGPR